jgi:hypothetical protein
MKPHTDRSRCLLGVTLRLRTMMACSEGTKDSQNQLPVEPAVLCNACVFVKHSVSVMLLCHQLNQKQPR